MTYRREELIIILIANMLKGLKHVAVGASSPIPAAASILAKELFSSLRYVSILGSSTNNVFTNGGTELFDCAAQGRIDAFFLSGGQIDGSANLNLLGIGNHPNFQHRFTGSFGSPYLYFMIPKVILFREEHSRRVMVPKVDFVSAAGISAKNIYRRGGPHALITNRCVFLFDVSKKKFILESIHPGESLETIKDNTGFDYDQKKITLKSAIPTERILNILRTKVSDEISKIYPAFCKRTFNS